MSQLYVALDLETTGLNSARDAIIEVGAIKFDGRRELGHLSSLVNPGRPIPLQITQLTGITNQDVMTAPPFAAVREKLARFVGNAVIVGHNIGFDLGFLRQQDCLRDNPSIDTFRLAAILMPHESRYSLGQLAESLGIRFDSRHRALDDARASMELFLALQARALDLPLDTLRTINGVARRSGWPLRRIFEEAERNQRRAISGSSIGAQLRAKGVIGSTLLASDTGAEKPLIPVDQRTALPVDRLAAMLEEDGALAQFPGFEYRPQQVEMLRAVTCAFNESRHLLVEAGTGTGKSIAYLLPAIHWAVLNGERVVISTNTINLQDQLFNKDIPDLRRLLPFEVRAAVLKGRSNYLCLRRLEMLKQRAHLSHDELELLAKVLVWVPNTLTGDRSELFIPGERERELWAAIASDADTCIADRCAHRRQGGCFFYRARRTAENAHLIIVNHALLLSDVATENRVLPPYNYLIADEAHHLEDATTYQLGYKVTARRARSLVVELGRQGEREPGYASRVLRHCEGRVPDDIFSELAYVADLVRENNVRVLNGLEDLFDALTAFVGAHGGNRGQYDYRIRLSRSLRLTPEWEQIEVVWDGVGELMQASLTDLGQMLDLLADLQELKIPGYADLVQQGQVLVRQLGVVYDQIESMVMGKDGDQVIWLQSRARSDGVTLCAVPLRVGQLVQQHLLWRKEAAVFTSATLCTNGDFSFIKERLGAYDAEELAVGSPFDYASQVLLYLPTDIPEPNEPYYQKTLNEALVHLARATRGRMLVLFTSYNQLRAAYKAVHNPLSRSQIAVYAQGLGASRNQLLENFRRDERAVLLGTRSFWEGVDVPGEALSCLVLTKLPFAVPSDPVFAARSEDVDNPFMQYAVPDAILRFRQGFGRLIRTRTDRGVVVVMDRRVQTKRYGDLFLNSLPQCTTVRGPLAELPQQAARWIDEGIGPEADAREEVDNAVDDSDELEYVSFDEL